MRRVRFTLLVLVIAAGAAQPATGRATVHELLGTGAVSAGCTGPTTPSFNGEWEGTCESSFGLRGTGFVSMIESHANFHSVAPILASGRVSVSWYDARGRLVFATTCQYLNGLAPQDGVGPLEVLLPPAPYTPIGTSAGCWSNIYRDRYAPGVQRLVATAALSEPYGVLEPIEFHGKLLISPEGSLA